MTSSLDQDVLTIGHSNLAADRFLAHLREHGVTAVADVRSVPFSRRFPWFSSRTLAERLHSKGIAYIMVGDTLGGRPANPALYRDGIADYEAMADIPDFQGGLDRVVTEIAQHRLCLMCSEREPLDCHRCLLVSRALARRGFTIGHILGDGSVEPHSITEGTLAGWPAQRRWRRHVRGWRIAAGRGLSPPCPPSRRPAVRPRPARPNPPCDDVLSLFKAPFIAS